MFAADAAAMPVHWYYDTTLLKRDYGDITGYVAPKDEQENGFLIKSNLYKTEDGRNVVGDVINKGKAHIWIKEPC